MIHHTIRPIPWTIEDAEALAVLALDEGHPSSAAMSARVIARACDADRRTIATAPRIHEEAHDAR